MLKASLLLVIVALAPVSILGQSQNLGAIDPTVQIRVGSDVSKAVFNLLDFGEVAEKNSAKVEVEVTNLQKNDRTIDVFTIGDNARAVWKDPDPVTGLLTRNTIKSEKSLLMDVDIFLANGPQPQIVLSEKGSVIASITIEFQPAEEIIPRLEYFQGVSAYGGGWGEWYHACLGPAPAGYTLDTTSVKYAISQQITSSHARSCGYYANCELTSPIPPDDTDVCFRWQAMGHHKDGALGRDPENQAIFIWGTLSANYRLKATNPKLGEVKVVDPKPATTSNQ